jgi:hypothetical protein
MSKKLLQAVRAVYPSATFLPEEFETDAAIEVSPKVHVQISSFRGAPPFRVNVWEDAKTMRHCPARSRIADVLADLRAAQEA